MGISTQKHQQAVLTSWAVGLSTLDVELHSSNAFQHMHEHAEQQSETMRHRARHEATPARSCLAGPEGVQYVVACVLVHCMCMPTLELACTVHMRECTVACTL